MSNRKADLRGTSLRASLSEQTEIDLEHGLEKAHISTLVETNLMLPQVDDKDFRRCK
jgi:hypothetical protein